MNIIKNYKPAVSKKILLFLAGLVWLLVGLMLMYMAYGWLYVASNINISIFIVTGVIIALLIHHFGFSKIANINLQRILLKDNKSCFFSFYPWKSYLIIVVMVILGITLRHSTIPKHYLAVLYIGIGLALALSSIRYFKTIIQINNE